MKKVVFSFQYNAMSVPYPKDSENVKSSLEVEQKEAVSI